MTEIVSLKLNYEYSETVEDFMALKTLIRKRKAKKEKEHVTN